MEEFLTKLNFVKKNNYINKLEKDNEKNKERIETYVAKFKKTLVEQELENIKNLETIKELSETNQRLQDENNNYKFILSKIPNWIIRLFARTKDVGGFLYGKK